MNSKDREKIADKLKNAPIIKIERINACADLIVFKGGRKAIFKPAQRELFKKERSKK